MIETWSDIEGYKGIFVVSSLGRVKSIRTNKLFKLTPNKVRGYVLVSFLVKRNYKKVPVHRLVAQAFIPNPDNKPQVNHKNGIKTDNRVENLEWMTARENCIHSRRVLKTLGRNVKVVYNKQEFSSIKDFALFVNKPKRTFNKWRQNYALYIA